MTVNLGHCNGAIFCLQKHGQEQTYPYFIDIQSNFLNYLSTRLVIPLARKQSANSQVKVLSPVLGRLCGHDKFTDHDRC
ncbi:TPA: CcdB family protein [Yersinia enterocolitica]